MNLFDETIIHNYIIHNFKKILQNIKIKYYKKLIYYWV